MKSSAVLTIIIYNILQILPQNAYSSSYNQV